jgi:hypothetical protein
VPLKAFLLKRRKIMRQQILRILKAKIILLFSFLLINCEDFNTSDSHNDLKSDTKKVTMSDEDLMYQGHKLALTKHARCRMGCRKLDAYEVQEVINKNRINPKKSKPASKGRCKSIAYEGRTRDGQLARIVVGDCADNPIVITVIDLENKYNCSCK